MASSLGEWPDDTSLVPVAEAWALGPKEGGPWSGTGHGRWAIHGEHLLRAASKESVS